MGIGLVPLIWILRGGIPRRSSGHLTQAVDRRAVRRERLDIAANDIGKLPEDEAQTSVWAFPPFRPKALNLIVISG